MVAKRCNCNFWSRIADEAYYSPTKVKVYITSSIVFKYLLLLYLS